MRNTTHNVLLSVLTLCLGATVASAQDGEQPDGPGTEAAPPEKAQPEKAQPAERAAPTPEQIEQAKQHYIKGAELFDAKDFSNAVGEFKESFRLSRNPILLYNIGYTLDELGDKDKATFYYDKFLQDAPPEAPNRDTAKQRLSKLRRQVDADSVFAAGTQSPKKKAAEPAPVGGVQKFQHNIVDEAPPGKPLDITAFIPEGAKWQVKLFYRQAGESKFTSVEMRPRYAEMVGRIPAEKTVGVTTLQYYVEVRDAGGKTIERSGRSTSPHLVFIEKTAKPRYYPDLTDNRDWSSTSAGSGSGAEVQGDGSWTDIHSSKFRYAKWTATGSAIGVLALSATFYFVAADASSTLEGEAFASNNDPMCAPPCRAFSDKQKDLQARGERFETLSNVALGVGVVAAAVAGATWYWEIKNTRKEKSKLAATPAVGKDYIGAAATLRF